MNSQNSILDFSPHLFWDTPQESVELENHRQWLVKRVLEKGTLADWNHLLSLYDKEGIRESVRSMRSLEKKALSFACAVLDLNQTELRCFINRSSQATHWNY